MGREKMWEGGRAPRSDRQPDENDVNIFQINPFFQNFLKVNSSKIFLHGRRRSSRKQQVAFCSSNTLAGSLSRLHFPLCTHPLLRETEKQRRREIRFCCPIQWSVNFFSLSPSGISLYVLLAAKQRKRDETKNTEMVPKLS